MLEGHTKTFWPKTFWIVRHGETDWNKERIYQGQRDIPLNETGRAQASQAAEILKNCDFDQIFSSPLSRAKDTAIAIATAKNIAQITDIADLMECQSIESAKYVLTLKGKTDFPSFAKMLPSDETAQSFTERVMNGLIQVLNSPARAPLIVAHGGVMTAIVQTMGLAHVDTPNCTILKFEAKNNSYGMSKVTK
jgi:probable phosphoglycerate mutase